MCEIIYDSEKKDSMSTHKIIHFGSLVPQLHEGKIKSTTLHTSLFLNWNGTKSLMLNLKLFSEQTS